MNVGLSALAFALGAVVSLGTSWVLVSRLERVGERLGLSEALLGLLAALAADAPEITASVTALAAPPSNGRRRGRPRFQRVQLGGATGPGSGRCGSNPSSPQGRGLQRNCRHAGRRRVPSERGGHTLGWGGARPCPLCPGPLHHPFGRTPKNPGTAGPAEEMDGLDDRRHRRGGERARRGHPSSTRHVWRRGHGGRRTRGRHLGQCRHGARGLFAREHISASPTSLSGVSS